MAGIRHQRENPEATRKSARHPGIRMCASRVSYLEEPADGASLLANASCGLRAACRLILGHDVSRDAPAVVDLVPVLLVEGATGQRTAGNLAALPFRGGAGLIAFLGRETGISPGAGRVPARRAPRGPARLGCGT